MSLLKPIAVIEHNVLLEAVNKVGFPLNHRMNLTPGGLGFDLFDKFIKANILLIKPEDFDKNTQIKLWSTSKIIGPVPSPENYYSRDLLSTDDFENGNPCLGNFSMSTNLLGEDYIADYVDNNGAVAVQEYIRVLISEDAKETYLGYGLEIPVERLWTIHRITDNKGRFWMERSVFPAESLCDEATYVRELTQVEIDKHFVQNEEGDWHLRQTEIVKVEDVPTVYLNDFEEKEGTYLVNVPDDVKQAMVATTKLASTTAFIKS